MFHQILSELNPLQYLPVVGTIYRAVTGDVVSDTARSAGSMVVSGLLGGPIGLVGSAAAMLMEKVTGIDPEAIGRRFLARLGVGPAEETATASPPAAMARAHPALAAPAPHAVTAARAEPAAPIAWTPAQLVSYGVSTTPSGALKWGSLEGAEALNGLELARLGKAGTAYSDDLTPPSPNLHLAA